jgi:hypothetical protein
MNLRALTLLPLLALAACGNHGEGGATTGAPAGKASATASAKPTAAPSASASATAAPSATVSAAPTASASPTVEVEVEPTGPVHIHLQTVKVTSGKSDGADKTLKAHMLKLRTACVAPALKVTPNFEGTLNVTLEVGADGKITKATPKVASGKIPDELQKCTAKFYEEKIQLEPSAAKIEETLLLGPKAGSK